LRGAGNLKESLRTSEGVNEMIPNDPVMLVSYVNMKLRDFYEDLDRLCEDLDIDKYELEEKLKSIEYYYSKERNQFV
jgi:CBS-domain-containing membrane protein